MSRIPKPSLREIRSRVATPVIIQTRENRLREIFNQIKQYELSEFADVRKERILNLNLRDKVGEILPFYERKIFDRFNSFSAFLPREIIFDFAERKNVEQIYFDKPMHAFINTYRYEGTEFTTTTETKKLIGADTAHKRGIRGYGETAVVVDTGGSRTHEQNRRMEFDTAMKGQHTDKNGHGQWCVSCVGGIKTVDERMSRKTGSTIECEGMAPECELVGIKSLGFVVGAGSTSNILQAMNIAVEKYDPTVISMSLGGESKEDKPEDDPFHDAIKEVKNTKREPVFCVAAGNRGPEENTIGSPGADPGVLTVGAYNPQTKQIADFSSRGPTNWGDVKPDCVAPGVAVHSGVVGYLDGAGDHTKNRYSPLSGTSMATPHISGLVCCMREAHENALGKRLNTEEIKTMLKELGVTKNNDSGWGALDWDMYETWLETEYGVSL